MTVICAGWQEAFLPQCEKKGAFADAEAGGFRRSMKMLLISDIHANYDALCAVWKKEGGADLVACAGDVVDYGFNPHECIAWLREHEAITIAGNHDRSVRDMILRGGAGQPDENGEITFAQYNIEHMTQEDREYICSLPDETTFSFDGAEYYMTHYYDENRSFDRSLFSYCSRPMFEQIWRERVQTAQASGCGMRRIIFGHEHQCMQYLLTRDAQVLNPGSVSYRLGPDGVASKGGDYMVIRDGEVFLRHVDYETSHLLEFAEKSCLTPFEKANARVFYSTEG